MALEVFRKDRPPEAVHFHIQEDVCENRVISRIWSAGGYLAEGFLESGKLVVFAHFEGTGAPDAENSADQMSTEVGIDVKKQM